MIKIAITGNIASGKSQVEKYLANKGYKVFDSDKIAHKILETDSKIKKEFASYDVFENNEISRKKMGKLIFGDTNLRKKLENIIHPKVKNKIEEIFDKNKSEKYVFVSIPLLFETNMHKMFDKVLLVTCNESTRLKRLISRDKLTKEEALKRINSQMPQETKEQLSDYIIKNESRIEDLYKQIDKLF